MLRALAGKEPKGLQANSKIGKRSQRIKKAQLRREGLFPAWVELPPRPQPREPIPDDKLPPGALAPHLQGILPIARRFLNAKQLAEALRPRRYGDIRYPLADANQPVLLDGDKGIKTCELEQQILDKNRIASDSEVGVERVLKDVQEKLLLLQMLLDLGPCGNAKFNLRICYLAGCRILLVINQEVEEHFKNYLPAKLVLRTNFARFYMASYGTTQLKRTCNNPSDLKPTLPKVDLLVHIQMLKTPERRTCQAIQHLEVTESWIKEKERQLAALEKELPKPKLEPNNQTDYNKASLKYVCESGDSVSAIALWDRHGNRPDHEDCHNGYGNAIMTMANVTIVQ
ncbi:hypothetical protein DAPPUDRAFT_243989 [Daphnia pulex]|uniref:Uncharacterized protein n=1 Tax=Daphnia pulex TaxID=6669 RepID=E9GJY7_DAPPU|nr:hypothetical protein DAPPUDRAFT_243989 [Daphnia pulex]|eukprot:EFX80200.1 hypothetical protein DAPPUDRAFT_243989 [Daphnia pulex]